jgi:hypothetical protein
MTGQKLTIAQYRAHKVPMVPCKRGQWVVLKSLGMLALALALPGCITVNAPAEPIVIELNINITQEVIYRLAADADNTIEENADIF